MTPVGRVLDIFRKEPMLVPFSLVSIGLCLMAAKLVGDAGSPLQKLPFSITRRDLQIGTKPDLGELSQLLLATHGKARKGLILAFVTYCTCDEPTLIDLQQRTASNRTVRIVIKGTRRYFDTRAELRPFKDFFIFDEKGRLTSMFNASVGPRAFAIDHLGKLVWQSNRIDESLASLIHQADRGLRALEGD